MVRHLLVEPTARALRGVRPLLETHGVIFSYKPPGLAYGTEDGVPGAWAQLRAMQESGEVDCERLIPVHRLDRVTSGLMMAAKTAEAATVLGTLLRERRLPKYYVAVTTAPPKKKMGTVVGGMVKTRRGAWMLTRREDEPDAVRATPVASTSFCTAGKLDGDRAVLIAKPLTGRTHQIRVALKSQGAPVLGDPLYARATHAAEERACLHAAALRLPAHPALVSAADLEDGAASLDIVCPPPTHAGGAFGTAAFCDIFGRWFGDDLGTTTWFRGTAIRSEPPAWRAESELAKLRRHAEQLDADSDTNL